MTTSLVRQDPVRTATAPRRGLTAFLLLAFGIAWGWIALARLADLSLVNPLVQLPFGFAPAVAAFVVRKWVTREGFGDAGLALRARTAWPYYLAAWFGPVVMVGVVAAAAALVGVWTPSMAPLDAVVPGVPGWALVLVITLVVPLLTPIYWGEEFGWTSYLRLRLFPERPVLSTVLTGLIWAVWHYPLAFVGYIEFGHVVLGLAVWTVSFQFQEILLSWLRVRSGSIWPASLAHAGNNMVLSLLSGFLLTDGAGIGVLGVTAFTAVPLGLGAAWIVLSGRLSGGTARDRC
ncbi:CAAX protease self-immunity [Streptoalloteichus tenebrarius]|uniref:CAAX protease self-immunity n=1 Tax=Streptoalloteichus tenebrarius (strain ATCC 17920 / DSM 40477 / JCM 4838 / CBS 697.72 / NBRC 16177 / NCIMB 11028 / NRRL B-12390 / A12253. 1 / ISP 5477) TaxID=1933 RepID=A0ABT1I1C4_STRSD|nr:CPBP family intramembrane glutamic endopeptidase [Streptoalloteichus tenebrarius]MCP2261597.1 CAAX protease self-immunity [Streptoalloteichus tenebrarius]BFE99402.1 CPBP family intramembrane metalloprotease [Streptoalloteichus tenebrarius]